MDKTARAWCSRRPRPRPSRRLMRTETVALWSCKQASDGNHILTKTELSVPNANCQYTRQPVRSVAQMSRTGVRFAWTWEQPCTRWKTNLLVSPQYQIVFLISFSIWICDLWVISKCALSMLRVALSYIDHVVVIWIKVWYPFSLCPQIWSEMSNKEENCLLRGRVYSW